MASTRIWVFDVEHGFAAFMRVPSGATMMIDCGRADDFSPALYIREYELNQFEQQAGYPITKLVVTHPHDDHIEDIATVIKYLQPNVIKRRRYDWEEVESESGGDYENLRKWAAFQAGYTKTADPIDWGGLDITHWGLSIEQAKELDEAKFINNSSIITIVDANGYKIVFPGDIEKDGWQELLGRDQDLCVALEGANIFVTSHHGHSSGYAPEVYDVMGKPDLNLSSIHHGDLDVEKAYSSPDRARGVTWQGEPRYHFTTRKDGTMLLEIDQNGHGRVQFLGPAY